MGDSCVIRFLYGGYCVMSHVWCHTSCRCTVVWAKVGGGKRVVFGRDKLWLYGGVTINDTVRGQFQFLIR
jgi:hypothetical protein